MNIFNINYKKLCRILLPFTLRTERIIAVINSLVVGAIEYIYTIFLKNRNNNMYNLDITPQVCKLEKALNDMFDADERRIHITDAPERELTYIYKDIENRPLFLSDIVYLYTDDEIGFIHDYAFVVNVPSAVSFDHEKMMSLLNKYRLISKFPHINIL